MKNSKNYEVSLEAKHAKRPFKQTMTGVTKTLELVQRYSSF